VNYLKIG